MDDTATTLAVVGFSVSLLVGPGLGALLGRWLGFEAGVAIACLVIGAAGLAAAGVTGWQRWQMLGGTEPIQGRLVDFVTETSRDAKGRSTTTEAPRVAYTAPDGVERTVKGLGGSLQGLSPGDAVELRYRPERPEQAVVGDFQNVWGIVWGMGLFGAFPTLFGLFFLGLRRGRHAPAAAPRAPTAATPLQRGLRTALTVLSNVGLVGAFVLMVAEPGDMSLEQSTGLGFMGIGAAAFGHFIAQSVPPAMALQSRAVFLIVGLGFAAFGFGAWKMG